MKEGQMIEQLNLAESTTETHGSAVPSMSYEEGVAAALRWALGQTSEAPMDWVFEECGR